MANDRPPERPRHEPEIIPPNRTPGSDWRQRDPFVFTARGGQHRIYVSRIGPFGFALMMLAIAALGAVFFVLLLGTILIWAPLVALLVIVAAVASFLRR
jgi:hypothetical protein